jgi:hypothetical protein
LFVRTRYENARESDNPFDKPPQAAQNVGACDDGPEGVSAQRE